MVDLRIPNSADDILRTLMHVVPFTMMQIAARVRVLEAESSFGLATAGFGQNRDNHYQFC